MAKKKETKEVEEKKETEVVASQEKRKTIVTKGICRKIQTAKYFSLEIIHQAEDVIEWETIEERDTKQQNLTKLLIKNFKETHDTILHQLGLGEVHAFSTDHIKEKTSSMTPDSIGLDMSGLDELG